MYVIDVLPLAANAPAGALSYRSSKEIPAGTIVTVILRRTQVPAIVLSCEPIRNVKGAVKAAPYALSGNVSETVIGRLSPAYMEAITSIADWHAASTGIVLSVLIGELIRANTTSIFEPTPGSGFSLAPLELPLTERGNRYQAFATRAKKSKNTLLFVVSTLAEVAYWKREFASFKPLVLSGALTGERRASALERARTSPPTVVISTPAFSFAPINRLTHIVIERAGAGSFRLLQRPYLDMCVALIEYARTFTLPVVVGDFPLPLEYRKGVRKFTTPLPTISVIDTRTSTGPSAATESTQEPWFAVPKELRARIGEEIAVGRRVAVLAVRKGYAPVVVCRDCGEALKDERGKLFTFSQQGEEHVFRTSDGKSIRAADTHCVNCGSWNLLPLGVGVERVAEELREAFPEAPFVAFTADTVRTLRAAERQLAPLAEPGSIVVGTEAMVPWLLAAAPAPLSLAAIASADSLLALPFWRARERFIRLAYLFAECADTAMLGTRLPNDTAVQFLRDPHNTAFFVEEESLRQALNYPPYGTLIAISFEGTYALLDRLEAQVRTVVSGQVLRQVPDRLIRSRTLRRTLVLTLGVEAWPNPSLSSRLATLSPSIRVVVDTESFW